ncbi:olfactory receptor 14A16-like [Rhineura floridana]|uniref:olfactory receptor 14A16-like n=1 Tax=Rhineura floridana TaxID=261503 RepID=UPI002AC80CF6|nr:olfactory receptor 14A16-like [Rhineura floridana]
MLHQTTMTEFVLLGFSEVRELQILYFVVFLFVYLAALLGNFLLIVTLTQDAHLHSPMYFFLANLSLSDVCLISVTIPKSMATSLTSNKLISFSGCVCQVFLVILFAGAELFLLTAMAYDCYVAICHPLQYTLIMNWSVCLRMAAVSWISSVVHAVVETANTFRLNFCNSNVIKQFFCDIPQLLILSCSDTLANKKVIFASVVTVGLFCFLCILVSYGYIFFTVVKIQSAQGKHKAFSTCTPHLTVFCLFLFTSAFSNMRPSSLSSPSTDLLAAVLYTVLPPLMNPIIYSLRNKDIQVAVCKMAKFWISQSRFIKPFSRDPDKKCTK